ncbi:MAG: (d)CMP kinase [Bacteroidales bacterium]|nr:(d)CMP kinase [Bacteroidales bacterium]
MFKEKIIIAIDGYSSTGKSSFARAIAAKLGYTYIDSGAIYRAITFFAIKNDLFKEGCVDEAALLKRLPTLSVSFSPPSPPDESEVLLDGTDVSREIRSLAVSEMVSPLSALPFVRNYVDGLLEKWGEQKGIVMDGRDIGTVVFPHAELKIFMTATPEVRAQRRYRELLSQGEAPSYEDILNNLQKRDNLDQHRTHAPLRCASDALVLDNSQLTPQEQMQWIEQILAERWG